MSEVPEPPAGFQRIDNIPPPPPGFVAKDLGGLPPSPMGAGGRFMTGLEDPLVGGSQLLTHTFGSTEQAKAADVGVQQRETELKAKGMESGDLMRGAGRMTATLPAMAVAGPVGGIAGAAAGGALTEAAMPVTGDNYWQQKTRDMLTGAAFGAAGGGATKVVGGAISPTLKEAPKALSEAGVQMTPGQLAGGIARRAEEAFKSLPILGSFIRGAEGRSIESFNRAVINQALEPIGISMPPTVKAGHEANTFAKKALDDAYGNLLPQMQLSMDGTIASELSNARFMASSLLPKERADQFDRIIKNILQRRFGDTGSISGRELKSAESELGGIATGYQASPDADQRQLGQLVRDVQGTLRDALMRQNPQNAAELQQINQAYAMFTRVEAAAARRATSEGIFMPSDLLAAIKAGDKSIRKGAFARGDAPLQEFAEFAQKVLPGKMPDSGTPERLAWDAAGIGAYLIRPEIPAGLLAASVPYTKAGTAAVNAVARPGPTREAFGRLVKGAAPYVGTGIESYLPKPFGSQ